MIVSPPGIDIAISSPSPAPTATPTPTLTQTPIPTASTTITSTITPDVAETVHQIVSELALNPDRTYEIASINTREYLIDTYNQAKMAKFVRGTWVETNLEERYGHLLPVEPTHPYIGSPNYIGDYPFHDSRDGRFLLREISPIATGNYNEVLEFDPRQGKDVRMTILQTIFEYQNKIWPLNVYVGSDDIPGAKPLNFRIYQPDGYFFVAMLYVKPTTEEFVQLFPPGTQFGVFFNFVRPKNSVPVQLSCSWTGECMYEHAFIDHLFHLQAEDLFEFNRRLEQGEDLGNLPETLIIPGLQIYLNLSDGLPAWYDDWWQELLKQREP
jgi:hypothetical protein